MPKKPPGSKRSTTAGNTSDPDAPLRPGLLLALAAVVDWLRAERIRGVVIGGIAASALGRARFTRDVDALILVDELAWADVLASASRHDIVPRTSDALQFASRSRVLLLKHGATGVPIDISLGALPFEYETVERARRVRTGRLSVPLPSAEDLIILKAVAGRPQDWMDIEAVIEMHPRLDKARIRRWVAEFAAVLENDDPLREIEARLASPRKRRHARRS